MGSRVLSNAWLLKSVLVKTGVGSGVTLVNRILGIHLLESVSGGTLHRQFNLLGSARVALQWGFGLHLGHCSLPSSCDLSGLKGIGFGR